MIFVGYRLYKPDSVLGNDLSMPETLSPIRRSETKEYIHYGENRQLQPGGLPPFFMIITYQKVVLRIITYPS